MSDIQQSLDAMQKTLDKVLIEVGQVFKRSKRDERSNSQPNTRVQTAIPVLTERFHYAIDDLEHDIIQAKAVLLRDLEKLRAKSAAAEAKLQPVPTLPEEPAGSIPEEVPSVPITIMDSGSKDTQLQFGGDGTNESTLDRLQKSIGDAQKLARSPNLPSTDLQASKESNTSIQTSTTNNRVLPNESPLFESPQEAKDQAEKQAREEPKKEESNSKDDTDEMQGLEISTSKTDDANAQAGSGGDIDSLFGGDNSISNDNPDFADIDFTGGEEFTFPENTPTAQNNTDLDSLMPGIESYAAGNTSEDFNMLDFHSSTTNAEAAKNTTDTAMDSMFDFSGGDNEVGGGGDDAEDAMDLALNTESAFDDLLDGMDFGDDDGTGGGGGMEHGEFDDAFFGLS